MGLKLIVMWLQFLEVKLEVLTNPRFTPCHLSVWIFQRHFIVNLLGSLSHDFQLSF